LEAVYARLPPPPKLREGTLLEADGESAQAGASCRSELLLNLFVKVLVTGCLDEHLTTRHVKQLSSFSAHWRRKLLEELPGRVFPGFPGLFQAHKRGGALYPHQLHSVAHMLAAETRSLDFNALRGGILGDEPGLGKTVTVMALILHTAGTLPLLESVLFDTASIQEGWARLLERDSNAELLSKVIKPLRIGFRELGVQNNEELDGLAMRTQRKEFPTLKSFENAAHRMIQHEANPEVRFMLRDMFRQETVNPNNTAL